MKQNLTQMVTRPLEGVICKDNQLVFHRAIAQEVNRLLDITGVNPMTNCLYVDYQVGNVLQEYTMGIQHSSAK